MFEGVGAAFEVGAGDIIGSVFFSFLLTALA